MPWTAKDAAKHTKKADTPKKARHWMHVANSALKSGDSEGSAVRQANAAVRAVSPSKGDSSLRKDIKMAYSNAGDSGSMDR